MNRMVKPLIGMVMVPIVLWAMWLNASEPLFGPNPAFVASPPSHSTVSRPTGFNPGYGE